MLLTLCATRFRTHLARCQLCFTDDLSVFRKRGQTYYLRLLLATDGFAQFIARRLEGTVERELSGALLRQNPEELQSSSRVRKVEHDLLKSLRLDECHAHHELHVTLTALHEVVVVSINRVGPALRTLDVHPELGQRVNVFLWTAVLVVFVSPASGAWNGLGHPNTHLHALSPSEDFLTPLDRQEPAGFSDERSVFRHLGGE